MEPTSPTTAKQEFAMKNLVLAAIAVLTLGIGSAYAQNLTPPSTVTHWGPAYSADVSGN
jgi:hypothetical protein